MSERVEPALGDAPAPVPAESKPPTPNPRAPKRRRRWLLWTLATFTALLALLVAGLYVLLDTGIGLRFALAQATRLSHGAVQIGASSGLLLGELELRDIRYAGSDGTRITIGRLHLVLRPRPLLSRRLHIAALDLDDVVLTPGTAAVPRPSTTPFTLPTRLPIDLVVDALHINRFERRAPGEAPPLKIEQAELAGSWLGTTLTIDRLATALPGTGPLHAQAKLDIAADHVDIEQLLLQGPGEISVTGSAGIGAAKSDLEFRWQQLQWPLLPPGKTPAQIGDVHGGAHLTGSADAYHFDLQTNATLQGRAAALSARGSGSLHDATLDSLLLKTLAGDGHDPKTAGVRGAVSAQGHVAWAPQLSAELTAQLAHLDPALFVASLPGDLNGNIDTTTTVSGARPEIVFSAELKRSTLHGQPFSLSAQGSTDTQAATLKNLLLLAGRGRVQAKGQVAWTPRLAANLEADIMQLDPALFAPGWTGDLNGHVTAKSASASTAPIDFTAQLDHSTLRGYPLKLDVQGAAVNAPSGVAVTLANARLDTGSSSLVASGRVTPPFDVMGRFDSPDLAALYPKLAGRAAFDFTAQGSLAVPHVVTHGEATQLRYGLQKIGRVSWDGDVDPNLDSHFAATVSAADVGVAIRSAKLNVTGRETYHRIELSADSERGVANLAVQGGYDRKRNEWGGELSTLAFTPAGMAAWSLEKGAGILVGVKRRALEPACLASAEGRACFNLEQNVLADGIRVGWNIEHLLLAVFQPLLPPRYTVSGTLGGMGTVNFTGGDLADTDATIALTDARLQVPDAPEFLLTAGRVQAEQRAGRLHGVAELATAQGHIDADVAAAPGAGFAQRALSGKITADVPSLAFLEPLLPGLQMLDGRLGGAFELAGSIGQPRLGGALSLSDGKAKLVAAGISVQAVNLKLSGNGDGPLTIDGGARSGEGALTLAGTINPYQSPLLADVTVKGDNFQALNTKEGRAWVSPDLRLVRDAKGASLSGTLTVPRTELTPQGFGGGGVEVSRDQVLVGAEAPPPKVPLPFYVELKLVLGDKVRIEGFGLKTRIEGDVTVTQAPEREALGEGELRLIDGRYKAYGQDLMIETGRLIFTGGPVRTPAVDIYATRHPREDITVGVRVRGTLAKPELTLQSSPTLPREQQLSWLVLGRSLDNSSSQDRSVVSSAALSLGLGGGDYLAGRLGKTIGLDQLSVGGANVGGSEVAANAQTISGAQTGTGTADQGAQAAQLTLGKYLTPRLFISYGISLFQQGYSFRLLYTLGHGFKLATESGTASGGDLIYGYEAGKHKTLPPALRQKPP